MRNILLYLIVLCLLVSCEVNLPSKYTPATPVDENPIQNMNDLFIRGDEGIVNFKTNNLQYYSTHGSTLWCLLETEQPVFSNRIVNLSKLSGNAGAGYGLVCCYRNDPAYGDTMLVVLINIEGEYTIIEINGRIQETIIPWQGSEYLTKGYNVCNTLKVEYNSQTMDYLLSINGNEEITFRDDKEPFHTSGLQGYMVVISPLDDFPTIPLEVQFAEQE